MADRLNKAKNLIAAISACYGPFSENHQLNIAIALAKSCANLEKFEALSAKEKIHDINILMSNTKHQTLFCAA